MSRKSDDITSFSLNTSNTSVSQENKHDCSQTSPTVTYSSAVSLYWTTAGGGSLVSPAQVVLSRSWGRNNECWHLFEISLSGPQPSQSICTHKREECPPTSSNRAVRSEVIDSGEEPQKLRTHSVLDLYGRWSSIILWSMQRIKAIQWTLTNNSLEPEPVSN